MSRKTAIVALLVFIPWVIAGHYLLISNVHSGGVLLWVGTALLLPDWIVSSVVSGNTRSNIWMIVLVFDFAYVWAVVGVVATGWSYFREKLKASGSK